MANTSPSNRCSEFRFRRNHRSTGQTRPGLRLVREKPMSWIITKYALTAATVVLVSEVAKRSDKLGGLLPELPRITLLPPICLSLAKQSPEKIDNPPWHNIWQLVPPLLSVSALHLLP